MLWPLTYNNKYLRFESRIKYPFILRPLFILRQKNLVDFFFQEFRRSMLLLGRGSRQLKKVPIYGPLLVDPAPHSSYGKVEKLKNVFL